MQALLSTMKLEVADLLRIEPPRLTNATHQPPINLSSPSHQAAQAGQAFADSVAVSDTGGESALFVSQGEPSSLPTPQPRLPQQVRQDPPDLNFFTQLSGVVASNLRTKDSSRVQPPPHCLTIAEQLDYLNKDEYLTEYDLLKFYDDNLHEYELGQALPIVKGRLKAHIQFWRDIRAPQWVLDTLLYGYVIPFSSLPPNAQFPNNKSARNNSEFVSQAINDLLKAGLVIELPQIPTVVNPLSVSFNSEGTPRLILDLRHVNQFIPKSKFRLEDWKSFINYAKKGGFAFKFDMKSGYHHIDICPYHQTFLGFQWPFNSVHKRYFCFTVLPFGLSSAPYLFTKLFRPLISHWRANGFQIVLYLDDGVDCESDFTVARHVSDSVHRDLIQAGITPNTKKSLWQPVQALDWLGIHWNFAQGVISVTHSRIQHITTALLKFKCMLPFVSPRTIASLVGRIISLSPVFGNVALLLTRFLQLSLTFGEQSDVVIDFTNFQHFEISKLGFNFLLS